MTLYEYVLLLRAGSSSPRAGPDQRLLGVLGTQYVIAPNSPPPPGGHHMQRLAQHPDHNVDVWRLTQTIPRAWIVHEVVVLDGLAGNDSRNPLAQRRRTHEVLFSKGQMRNLREVAVVEVAVGQRPPDLDSQVDQRETRTASDETCTIRDYRNNRVLLDVKLHRAGLVVMSDLHWQGWVAWVESEDNPQPWRAPS